MNTPARQPQGIPTGGQFAPDARAEPSINLSPAGDKIHTAELRKTIELRNADFDQLPEWPATLPQPEVSFDFSDGKCETNITVDDKMMTFWDSDSDGTINDTDNGNNPWEDFDEEDQEMALEWGKRVHQRIDSSTYGIMIEASCTPEVNSIILAHSLGKDPSPAPDLTHCSVRDAYLTKAEARLAAARDEIQNIYMIGAAQELREDFPVIDSFNLVVGDKHMVISEAWDADGNPVSDETLGAATQAVFRYREEDDFNTFTDQKTITVEDAINFRPAG
ncbi:hypothetical protein GCM10023063_14970 [Arthrobacter methylotrophus]|uniref:Uncharacterized protein n=1 Tax=Arthrobacter methylotrophus TaxID=121291 RepID=A0ABV5UN10_9MICC